MLASVLVSLALWLRWARRDERLIVIYVSALGGAFVGAKLVYLAAEGWLHWAEANRWVLLATGKSITGALLGGYAGVELAKRGVSYKSPTGDRFAVITALGVMLGRVGCQLHGCCLGRIWERSWFTAEDGLGLSRWPAATVELLFNALALGVLLFWQRRGLFAGQRFHLYLMAYGLFRFLHEFVRDTPRILGPLSGYHMAAAGLALLGATGYVLRHRSLASVPAPMAQAEARTAKARPRHLLQITGG